MMLRYFLSLLILTCWSTGCSFRVLGIPAEELFNDGFSVRQDGGLDGPAPDSDLAIFGNSDALMPAPDLPIDSGLGDVGGPTTDLTIETDLAGIDLSGLDLLVPPVDMAALIVPSHVGTIYLLPGAAALGSVTEIDTLNLTLRINGGSAQLPPGGTSLLLDATSGLAVLSVGAFTIEKNLNVIGNRGLVVVASGGITISALVTVNGRLALGGPGAFVGGNGAGGAGGQNCTNRESGGGGAGHLSDGAVGGSAQQLPFDCPAGGAAGKAYGPLLSDFLGGSIGGTGGRRTDDCSTSVGGAGGGAIQFSSSVSVTVTETGAINAGGGGGAAGCDQPRKTAGGGGGSGGTIFLEAPMITILGKLASNGGGGGSGGGDSGGGLSGQDGQLSTTPAAGGMTNGGGSGPGGTGGAAVSIPQQPGAARNAGGGGGAAGYIYLRTRITNATLGGGSVVSPNPVVDLSL